MRFVHGIPASPKCPTLEATDQMMASATMSAAAAANTGRQRTATQRRTGKTRATGMADSQGPFWQENDEHAQKSQSCEPYPALDQFATWRQHAHSLAQSNDQRSSRYYSQQ